MTVRGRGGRRSKAQLEADARYRDYQDKCAEAWEEWERSHPCAKLLSYLIPAMLVFLLSISDIGEEKVTIGTVLIRMIGIGLFVIPLISPLIELLLRAILK